jgi:GNAT superfamily N-acetyltransferase
VSRFLTPHECHRLVKEKAMSNDTATIPAENRRLEDVPASGEAELWPPSPTPGPNGDGRIRRAGPGDAAVLADTLASAFQDDPVFAWAVPDPRTRDAQLPRLFRVIVDGVQLHEATYHIHSRGVALWVPPDRPALDPEADARLAEAVEALGPDVVDRWVALVEVMEERHPHQSHHYLWFLGVHESAQGQGLGSALLRDRLAWCDENTQAAYLEATSPRNRALYARYGFEVTDVLTAGDSPPMWAMWRDPR